MSQVVTFIGYTPPQRFDNVVWTIAIIEEAATADGTWATIDTITLDPVDTDATDPLTRSFTTENGTATGLWYRITFEDGAGGVSDPSLPVQNVVGQSPFATTDELFRILKIRTPSTDQIAAAERVLVAAAGEIRSEIDLAADVELEAWQISLCAQVNLDRAADLWRHTESIPGITGLIGDEAIGAPPGRYSWERYAQRLAPVKNQWGLA